MAVVEKYDARFFGFVGTMLTLDAAAIVTAGGGGGGGGGTGDTAGWNPVRVATTASIGLFGLGTIDGVSVLAGDRVLLKNQADPKQNGIYVASTGLWTRATDANTNAHVKASMHVFVAEGTANHDTGWMLTTDDPISLGSSSLNFAEFTANPANFVTIATNQTITGVKTFDGNLILGAGAFDSDINFVPNPGGNRYLYGGASAATLVGTTVVSTAGDGGPATSLAPGGMGGTYISGGGFGGDGSATQAAGNGGPATFQGGSPGVNGGGGEGTAGATSVEGGRGNAGITSDGPINIGTQYGSALTIGRSAMAATFASPSTFSNTLTASDGFTSTLNDTATNAITDVETLIHTTTGTTVAGVGTGVLWRAKNGSGATTDIARMAGVLTAVGASPVGVIDVFTRAAGSPVATSPTFRFGTLAFHIGTTISAGTPGVAMYDGALIQSLGVGGFSSTYLQIIGASGGICYIGDPRQPSDYRGSTITFESNNAAEMGINGSGEIWVGTQEGIGSTPTARILRGAKPAGTNLAGVGLQLGGGPGTGNGIAGPIQFYLTTPVASGSGAQTETEAGRWDGASRALLVATLGDGSGGNPAFSPGTGLGLAWTANVCMVNSAGTGILNLISASGTDHITFGTNGAGALTLTTGSTGAFMDFNVHGSLRAKLWASGGYAVGTTSDPATTSILLGSNVPLLAENSGFYNVAVLAPGSPGTLTLGDISNHTITTGDYVQLVTTAGTIKFDGYRESPSLTTPGAAGSSRVRDYWHFNGTKWEFRMVNASGADSLIFTEP